MIIRGAHIVGDEVSTRTRFFAEELEGSGPLDGRRYYAYLLTDSRGESFAMIDPPSIPTGAIRLGTVSVSGPVTDGDGYPYGVATLTFTVPDVPSGDYSVGFCDDPCTHSTIGWLAWGRVRIVHTPFEGQLLERLDRVAARSSRFEFQLRRSERALEKANAEIDQLAGLWGLSRPAPPVVEPLPGPAIGSVETRVIETSVTWWVAVLAAVAGLGLGITLTRRRQAHPKVVVPDTIPDDLDDRHRLDEARRPG
ncbi:MAG TPA: hypothetical protein VLA90_05275 [Actinomycetota bacterium]|nr:hypothetical protein [Actinomycetota bacterium]